MHLPGTDAQNRFSTDLVDRLINYLFNYYPAYAYSGDHLKWLELDAIMLQSRVKDRHRT